jgi:hypothetical protein
VIPETPEELPFSSGVSVTSAEMFCVPDCVVPLIVNSASVVLSAGTLAVGGVIVIADTVSATVAVVVPVTAPEAPVIVAVPAETPAKTPPVLMVATEVSELDQHTILPVQLVPPLRLPVLPSLYVATAVIWTVVAPVPKPTVGVGGSTVSGESTGQAEFIFRG